MRERFLTEGEGQGRDSSPRERDEGDIPHRGMRDEGEIPHRGRGRETRERAHSMREREAFLTEG